MASFDKEPGKSCLLAKTKSVAPANRYSRGIKKKKINQTYVISYEVYRERLTCYIFSNHLISNTKTLLGPNKDIGHLTSSSNKVLSSFLQSSSLNLSALSTTHTSPSVLSK